MTAVQYAQALLSHYDTGGFECLNAFISMNRTQVDRSAFLDHSLDHNGDLQRSCIRSNDVNGSVAEAQTTWSIYDTWQKTLEDMPSAGVG